MTDQVGVNTMDDYLLCFVIVKLVKCVCSMHLYYDVHFIKLFQGDTYSRGDLIVSVHKCMHLKKYIYYQTIKRIMKATGNVQRDNS